MTCNCFLGPHWLGGSEHDRSNEAAIARGLAGAGRAEVQPGSWASDFYEARVRDTDSVLDTGFAISAEPLAEHEFMLISRGGGDSLVVYRSAQGSCSSGTAVRNSERVMACRVHGP